MAATAYAALTSLKNIIHDLQNHPSPPISINEQQVQSLTEIVTSLQEFLLRGCSSNEEAGRIADAARAAKDVIESEILDRIRSQSTLREDLYRDLQLEIEGMNLIKEMATAINASADRPQLGRNVSTIGIASSEALSTGKNNNMVGFDGVFGEVLERLILSQPDLQIIPITGMGGIGKTTLAQNLFENASVRERFDIRAWTSISQNYNARKALNKLFGQARGEPSDLSESEVGVQLHKYLFGRRYLIVLDDAWSIEVSDKIKVFFPNNKDGSRVIVTTRQSNLASHLSNCCFNMKFLDGLSSWNLFSKTVFDKESFPLELEYVGKKIVRKCGGLPLSIVTIGGLLAKSEQTQKYWEYIEGNINSLVNSEDDEYCLGTLRTSYNHLPVHLKPCFLHMGVFAEDSIIRVSELIKLWIVEGFLQPTSEKSLEKTALENLEDLVDRNLILVHEMGSTGNIKSCKIHDLLRDLSRREARKERFYYGTNYDRYSSVSKPLNLRLSSILEAHGVSNFQKYVLELVNSRYLSIERFEKSQLGLFPINLFWNLHSLIVDYSIYEYFFLPIEIWSMHQLRHVKFSLKACLPDPPTDNFVVMENLVTLKGVMSFKLNPEVVRRIPNVKRLTLRYDGMESNGDDYCLNYLECMHKLESFQCFSFNLRNLDTIKKLTFPQSLKKLTLYFNWKFELEGMLEKIGSLPRLQKLDLRYGHFRTREWKTVEGQFHKLKFLTLASCHNLERWTSESSHFPLLKEINLIFLMHLKEIPLEIGDIPTLKRINVEGFNMSAVMCLKRIVEEQEELQGGEQLSFYVQVATYEENREALQMLQGRNFKVIHR